MAFTAFRRKINERKLRKIKKDMKYFHKVNIYINIIFWLKPDPIPGLDKSRTCVLDVLEIINFTNYRTPLFFNKYAHEHTFSVY